MVEPGYHGWKNYETWAFSSWIQNNEDNEYLEALRRIKEPYPLSIELKRLLDDNNPLEPIGVYYDLLSSAISEIDFLEVAENLLRRFRT